MTIPREVKDAYDKEYPGGWKCLDDQYKQRLERAWSMHVQCDDCKGAGWTKAEVHLMSMDAAARMAADPVLAKQPIPIFKTECRRCQGLGLVYTGK